MKKRDILIAVGIFLVILVILMPMKKCEIKDNYYLPISNIKNPRVRYTYDLSAKEIKDYDPSAKSVNVKIYGVMLSYNETTKDAIVQPYIVETIKDGNRRDLRTYKLSTSKDVERKKIFELPSISWIHTIVRGKKDNNTTDPENFAVLEYRNDELEQEISNTGVTIPDINQELRKVGSLVMYKYISRDKPNSALCADKGDDVIYIYGIINSINSNNNTARIIPLSIEVKGPTSLDRCKSPSGRVVFTRFQDTNNLKNYKEWIDWYFGDASKAPVYDQLLVTDVPMDALLPVTSIPLI
jgi:hypothetical protein